jgi:hypothetical protein
LNREKLPKILKIQGKNVFIELLFFACIFFEGGEGAIKAP